MATYSQFYAQLRAIIDSINHDTDPIQRLQYLHQLNKDTVPLLIEARNEAAYDLRTAYRRADAQHLTGIGGKEIDYWANRWRVKHRLPPARPSRTRPVITLDLRGE